jgi:hypothetical protein
MIVTRADVLSRAVALFGEERAVQALALVGEVQHVPQLF